MNKEHDVHASPSRWLDRVSDRIWQALEVAADSGDRERPIRSIMNTDSGDHEHPIALA